MDGGLTHFLFSQHFEMAKLPTNVFGIPTTNYQVGGILIFLGWQNYPSDHRSEVVLVREVEGGSMSDTWGNVLLYPIH